MSVVSIVIQSLLILVFLAAGSSKLAGSKQQVESFRHLGLQQWFRVVTGIVHYIGIAGLTLGFWYPGMIALAAIWLAVTMVVACIVHFIAQDPIAKAAPAFALSVLAIALLILNIGALQYPFIS